MVEVLWYCGYCLILLNKKIYKTISYLVFLSAYIFVVILYNWGLTSVILVNIVFVDLKNKTYNTVVTLPRITKALLFIFIFIFIFIFLFPFFFFT
jgi:hypothetical protein